MSGEHPYIGYVVRAHAHMQLYKERHDWEQVNEELGRAIMCSSQGSVLLEKAEVFEKYG